MSKVTAPLLSFTGSGQIAKTQVYAQWKGIPYVRRYVIPANPQSTEQTKTRNMFSWLNDAWRIAPADFQAPWTAAAQGRPLTNRNLFLSKNTGLLRAGTVLTGLVMSPGAKGGIAGGITMTAGAAQITFAGTPPSPLPAGWSVVALIGAAVLQQNPQTGVDHEITVVSDTTSTYSVVMSGLAAATAYVAAGWWVYQRSAVATDLAYSPAPGEVVTTL